jgi:hypothetical protein
LTVAFWSSGALVRIVISFISLVAWVTRFGLGLFQQGPALATAIRGTQHLSNR